MKISEKEILFLARFIVESDAIENITADSQLVENQLKARWREGHVGAMLLLESLAWKKNKFLSKNIVCRAQGLITAEQHTKPGGDKLKPEWIGKFRLINVSIGGRLCPDPNFVPTLMKSWVFRVITWQKEHSQYSPAVNLQQIAIFHYEYEHIHPFADGNGRSGRALVYYLMRYCGLNPFIFTSNDKYETYYQCFSNSQVMFEYFESKVKTV